MLQNNSKVNSPTFQTFYGNYSSGFYNGVACSPGIGSKGSWVSITPASTYTPNDVFGVFIQCSELYIDGTSKPCVLDIGVDPSGGTSYTTVISNLQVGGSAPYYVGGVNYYFPLYIKGGSQLGMRTQATAASVSSRILLQFLERPTNLANSWVGSYSETIGYVGSSLGTSFTPGTNSKGSWTSLGTTTLNLKYFQLSAHIDNTTLSNVMCYMDLAYGDGTNFVPILSDVMMAAISTSEAFVVPLHPTEFCFRDVPAGSTLYVRGVTNGSPPSGFHATVIGIGG